MGIRYTCDRCLRLIDAGDTPISWRLTVQQPDPDPEQIVDEYLVDVSVNHSCTRCFEAMLQRTRQIADAYNGRCTLSSPEDDQ